MGPCFLIAEGRSEGRLSARYRGANFPRTRATAPFLPDFRGVLETDDGATVLFAWHGYAIPRPRSKLELVGSITHVTDDERYRRPNDVVCALTGEVRPRADGSGYEVVLDVAELVWEPLESHGRIRPIAAYATAGLLGRASILRGFPAIAALKRASAGDSRAG